MFKDRKDAGKRLAKRLLAYKDKNVLVLAIPRGGVEVGYYVAKELNADFSLIIARKLPIPHNPEAGFGAIAEDGTTFMFPDAGKYIGKEEIKNTVKEQKNEIKRRIAVLRENKPFPKIKNKIIILVDDGLAMGSTMIAAIRMCRKKGAKKIIVAVPVAGKDALELVQKEADSVFVVTVPANFYAVAQAYKEWHDVTDNEAMKIMTKKPERKVSLLPF